MFQLHDQSSARTAIINSIDLHSFIHDTNI